MRPLKRPTNQCWVSFRKKVFQWPLKEAKRGQEQIWPERANFEILLWISYVRITERWKILRISNWERLQWPQKFNTFTRMGLRDLDAGKQQVRDTHFQSWGVWPPWVLTSHRTLTLAEKKKKIITKSDPIQLIFQISKNSLDFTWFSILSKKCAFLD